MLLVTVFLETGNKFFAIVRHSPSLPTYRKSPILLDVSYSPRLPTYRQSCWRSPLRQTLRQTLPDYRNAAITQCLAPHCPTAPLPWFPISPSAQNPRGCVWVWDCSLTLGITTGLRRPSTCTKILAAVLGCGTARWRSAARRVSPSSHRPYLGKNFIENYYQLFLR